MIDYLYANNYKSLVNFRIEFSKLDLLLGKNGSGKSNIFGLIFSLVEMIKGKPDAINTFLSNSTLTRWMKSDIQTFELGLSEGKHKYVYRVEIEQKKDIHKGIISFEQVSRDGQILYQMENGTSILYDDDMIGTPVLTDRTISGISYVPDDGKHSFIMEFKSIAFGIIFCSPDPKAMMGNVEKEELGAKVNFSNIASIYSGILQTDTEVYGDLMKVLRDINPHLCRYKIAMNQMGRFLVAEYKYNDILIDYYFNELSEGEKMTFALYLILYGFIKKGYTVLLDEPDNYLSLREIQPWCSEIESEVKEKGQCILISHHPEIIDYLAKTNGIWLSRIKSGETVKVEDPYEIIENKDLLSYSEIIARGLIDEVE